MSMILDEVNAFADWSAKEGGLGVFGLAAGIIGASFASMAICVGCIETMAAARLAVRYVQYHRLQSRLDDCKSEIFRSVDDGIEQGHSRALVERSFGSARYWHELSSTGLYYKSGIDCYVRHGSTSECWPARKTWIANMWDWGKYDNQHYQPDIIAIQVAAHDMRKAVPVYTSHEPNYGLRADGTMIRLKPIPLPSASPRSTGHPHALG